MVSVVNKKNYMFLDAILKKGKMEKRGVTRFNLLHYYTHILVILSVLL